MKVEWRYQKGYYGHDEYSLFIDGVKVGEVWKSKGAGHFHLYYNYRYRFSLAGLMLAQIRLLELAGVKPDECRVETYD